jgi:hypothetical protein
MDQVHDPRFLPRVVYNKRLLLWWGLFLFLGKLGSRRALDVRLDSDGPQLLDNLNRLADTEQDSRPVNKTLEYFLRRSGADPVADLRHRCVDRLIRMKALNAARLQRDLLVLVDASGYLVFHYKHCDHCLTQQCGDRTLYMHQVLEAKVLGPGGTVFSLATEFIDNRDLADTPADASAEQRKQDCELKALPRLLAKIRAAHPQLRICLGGDSLFACGAGLQAAKDYRCDYLLVFKPGRTPALWQDFLGLLELCPEQRVQLTTPEGVQHVYRWVNGMDYQDSEGRRWKFNALQCQETKKNGEQSTWAWVTPLELNRATVQEVAKGGRERWREENEGFNAQKNGGMNLEHAYSHKCWAAYYYLLQIGHMLSQLLEKGSLLRQLAQEQGKRTAVALFGSWKDMAVRLVESLRYWRWPEESFDAEAARKIQIRLDSS